MNLDFTTMAGNLLSGFNLTPGSGTGIMMAVLLGFAVFGPFLAPNSFVTGHIVTFAAAAAAVFGMHLLLINHTITWVFEDYLPAQIAYPSFVGIVVLLIAIVLFAVDDMQQDEALVLHDEKS